MLRNGGTRAPGVEILVTKPVIIEDPPLDPSPDPGGLSWIQAFSDHLTRLDTPQKRLAQMVGVQGDLERMIGSLAPSDLPAAQLEGLQQRLEQARQIADSPASCSAFEVNIFWLLLEQEVRAVAVQLRQRNHLEALEIGWAMAGEPSYTR